ncbi:MAG: hypothetical protein MSA09_10255, partial [Lachnospiraceae bacterium]|nr:hypothetical protein [Lachnospiraceae bacterium]
MTIEGGKVRGINAGMTFGFNGNDPLDLTLSGTIDFGESNPSYPVFVIGYNAPVNLHMDGLTTDKLFINIGGSGAGEISNVICDGDYSSYFVFPQYLVSGKATDNGKYLLNLTQRSITTQPTEENPQVAVNDTNNVTYQWYQAAAVEKEITDKSSDNTIAAEPWCGSYADGYWKPGMTGIMNADEYYMYALFANLLSGGQIVLEAPTGSSLDNLENYLWCMDGNTGVLVEKENVDGKLYFTIPSAGPYGIMSTDMDNHTYDCNFTGDEQIKITFKGIEIKEAVEGSTQSRLVTSKPGSFCCKATWAAGTPFEYSTVSDTVTVTQPVEPTKYAVTVTDGTTASEEYAAGETVTITANAAPERKKFDKWEVVSGDVTLADASLATTTFTMPENAVEVKATYKDASGEPTP